MEREKRAVAKPDIMHPSGALIWWIAVVLAGFAGLLVALGSPHLFGQTIKAGEFAEQNLVSNKRSTIVDQAQTRLAQQKARESVLPVFKHDRAVDLQILSRLAGKLDCAGKIQEQVGLPLPAGLGLTPLEQVYLLECADEVWQRLAPPPGAKSTGIAIGQESQAVRPAIEVVLDGKLRRLLEAPPPNHSPAGADGSAHAPRIQPL